MLVSGNKLSSSSSSSRVATPSTAEFGGFSSSPSSLGMLSSSSPSASYIKFQMLYHWIVTRYIWVKKNAYCVKSQCDGVRLSKANKQDKSKTKHVTGKLSIFENLSDLTSTNSVSSTALTFLSFK